MPDASYPFWVGARQFLGKLKDIGSGQHAKVVALDTDSLTALDTVTANQGTAGVTAWPVALDAPSLAALETTSAIVGLSETMGDGLGNVATLLSTPLGNQTASAPLAAYPFVWNGTTWDRLPGTTAGLLAKLAAGETHIGQVGGHILTPSASMTRPADVLAYAVGDLVANSTVAGSVVPLSFTVARVVAGSGMIRRCRLYKSGTSMTNATFRLHLYSASPTVTNGDNGAWLSNQVATYLGAFDVAIDRAFSDGAAGNGVPVNGGEISEALTSGQLVYGLLEARGVYTPVSGEIFTAALEVWPN